ncbi:MAG: hypothetical protein QOC97_556, partial [Chloroflexota bacterium]|nr:hypothetical protein [Chloroflexota bacterium]
MTSERDFDRLARVWLELGPDEAPDRVIAAVLQAAEATPQARRPLRWPVWRSITMSRLPIFATAVAILVVVVGGGLFLSRSNGPAGIGVPSASPTALPSTAPSASAAPVPAALSYTWIGPKRTISGMPTPERYRFQLSSFLLDFPNDDFNQSVLSSLATAPVPGQLRLVTSDHTAGCSTGDEGRYGWSLSAGGVRLTLTAITDACATRATALAGDWIRVDCKDTTDGCFGDLEAGTFPSQYIDPRIHAGTSWHPNFGAITYTVPAGWSNSSDWPGTFTLAPTSDYGANQPGTVHDIYVYRTPAANAQNAACTNNEPTSVKQTVDGLVAWVRSRPSLVVTAPTPVIIDGHSGQWVDVKIAPNWTATCPDAPGVTAVFLTEAGAGTNGYSWGIAPGELER